MRRAVLGSCVIAAGLSCTPRAEPGVAPKDVTAAEIPDATSSDAPVGLRSARALRAFEIAHIEDNGAPTKWSVPRFRFHQTGDDEKWVSFGLFLARASEGRVSFSNELSRGLPLQSDPCFTPYIDEIHRDDTGALILTLVDDGTLHFTGGCLDQQPSDTAYTWSSDRWVAMKAPAWAPTPDRRVFSEARVGGKTVRLMGPHVSPESDGWNPPSAFFYLRLCGKSGHRSVLAGWDLPASMPSLPSDLCVEGLAFGRSMDDAMFLGRTANGAMWLERRSKGQPPERARVPIPKECTERTSPTTQLSDANEGQLAVEMLCSDTPGDEQNATERTLHYRYGGAANHLQIKPDPSTPEAAREATPVAGSAAASSVAPLVLAEPTHGFRVSASTDGGSQVSLVHGDQEVLADVSQAMILGEESAVAEIRGQLFLIARDDTPPPPMQRCDTQSPAPEAKFLSLPPKSSSCQKGLLVLARVPQGSDSDAALDRKRADLLLLAKDHPEIAQGPEPFVEVRIGDEIFLGRYDTALWEDSWAKIDTTVRKRASWAKIRGLTFDASCIFWFPAGAGRTFKINGGAIDWVSHETARSSPW